MTDWREATSEGTSKVSCDRGTDGTSDGLERISGQADLFRAGIGVQTSQPGFAHSRRTRWAATTLSRPADTSPSRPGAVPEVNHATVEPA
jgi:hypothetical protein